MLRFGITWSSSSFSFTRHSNIVKYYLISVFRIIRHRSPHVRRSEGASWMLNEVWYPVYSVLARINRAQIGLFLSRAANCLRCLSLIGLNISFRKKRKNSLEKYLISLRYLSVWLPGLQTGWWRQCPLYSQEEWGGVHLPSIQPQSEPQLSTWV